jgi:FtsH-binding integral membrane protein
MKKIIILTMLLGFAAASFGQQVPDSNPAVMQTDYIKKSKKQKTWAWITTGLGVIITASAWAADSSPVFGEVPLLNEVEQASYTTAFVIGGACIASGIVLFIASSQNKKKANAASVFFDIKKAPMLQQIVIRNQPFPALGVRISL